MMIALTTANFPDVMLPAYYRSFFYMFFFLIYLTIGIYFLISILIANVFNKYKNRLEERINDHANKRRDQIEKAYSMFAREDHGFLTQDEFKEFFAFVFDLDLEDSLSRRQYRKVLARLEMSEGDSVPKDLVVDFIVERGAIELRKAADEILPMNASNDLAPLNGSVISNFNEGGSFY